MRFPTVWNSLLRALALDSLFKGTGIFGGFLMGDFQFDRTKDVEILKGWFWVAKREAITQVGLLDERFFMYGEDMDWCRRFHRAGWRVVFNPHAEAIHYGGGSSSNAPVRFYVEQQRANLQYWKKHHGRISLSLYLFTVWINQATRVLGHGLVYLARGSSRPKASYKVRRSYACMRWLVGLRATEPEVHYGQDS
jgi:GT2 family glycosyltransferase